MAKFKAVVLSPEVQTVTIEAYVPNRMSDGSLVHNHEHWVRLVESALCAASGGGCTTYEARGRWGGAYEHTTIVRAAVPQRRDSQDALIAVLGAFGVETKQEVAGYTVDGVWWFVAPANAPDAHFSDYVPEVAR
jgi:hypothetical protein